MRTPGRFLIPLLARPREEGNKPLRRAANLFAASVTANPKVLPLFCGRNFNFVSHVPLAGHVDRFAFDDPSFLFGAHRSAQGHIAVLGDDLYIMRISRQLFILHDGAANLSCNFQVGSISSLIARRRMVPIAVTLVHPRIVRIRRLSGVNGLTGQRPSQEASGKKLND